MSSDGEAGYEGEDDDRSYDGERGEEHVGERRGADVPPEPPPREPVSAEDVEAYARYLGVDVEREPHLLPIAHEALSAALPEGWEEVDDGENVYFHRAADRHSQYEHPLEEGFRQIISAYRGSGDRHRPRCCAQALALPLDALGGARAYELQPADADGLIVHLSPAEAAAPAAAAAPARRAPVYARTICAPPVLACSAERARRARARRRAPGARLALPPPVWVSREPPCSGGLRCELGLLQATCEAWGLARPSRAAEIRQRGKARLEAPRQERAAAAGCGAAAPSARPAEEGCAPAERSAAAAHDDERWPAWARAEIRGLQAAERTLLPPELRDGFCAMAPAEAVLAAVRSLRLRLGRGPSPGRSEGRDTDSCEAALGVAGEWRVPASTARQSMRYDEA